MELWFLVEILLSAQTHTAVEMAVSTPIPCNTTYLMRFLSNADNWQAGEYGSQRFISC